MQQQRQYSYDLSVKSDVSDELINVYLSRPVAGLLVRILFHTAITPNQVTVAATLSGCAGAVLYFSGTSSSVALAGIFVILKDLLDSADGQLARAKQMYSRAGRFLDSIGDFLVNLVVFAGIGYTLVTSSGSTAYAFLAVLAFLGITLRVSYHVYYQTSFLHLQKQYATNRITEEVRDDDLQSNSPTLLLQRIFQMLYGWQDRIMVKLDGWCRKNGSGISDNEWFADRTGLRLSGLLGLGTELYLLAACSLANQLELYLYCNLLVMNCVALVSIWYRRSLKGKEVSGQKSQD